MIIDILDPEINQDDDFKCSPTSLLVVKIFNVRNKKPSQVLKPVRAGYLSKLTNIISGFVAIKIY